MEASNCVVLSGFEECPPRLSVDTAGSPATPGTVSGREMLNHSRMDMQKKKDEMWSHCPLYELC